MYPGRMTFKQDILLSRLPSSFNSIRKTSLLILYSLIYYFEAKSILY